MNGNTVANAQALPVQGFNRSSPDLEVQWLKE